MSILAAGICKKNGDLLLSRQFSTAGLTSVREMEEAYPVLLSQGSQHSALEKDGLRYIFESLDDLFVTLVSDADTSNILQDLKTLRLLTQLVKASVIPSNGVVTSKAVIDSYYGITDAFDEAVTMGFSENLSASQVQTFLKMESHEEKIQQIIERNKQLEAAEERKKKAKQLEAQRHASAHSSSRGIGSGIGSGMGSGLPSGLESSIGSSIGSQGGSSIGSYGGSNTSSSFSSGNATALSSGPSALKGKGMKLGKKTTQLAAGSNIPLLAEPEHLPTPASVGSVNTGRLSTPGKVSSPVPTSTTTDISISEQLTVEFTRDGKTKTSRVSGTLNLFAGDREHTKLRIQTTTGGGASDYKPHPKMDRALFSKDRTLGLKNSAEDLPASHVLLAKWTVDNVIAPITIACWVSDAADRGFLNVTMEYEVNPDFEGRLENLAVNVSLPTSNAHVADPASKFEQFDDRMVWLIPYASVTDAPTGSFEFVAEAETENDFYPLEVTFATAEQTGEGTFTTFGKIDVDSIIDASSGEAVEFTKTAVAQTASYTVR